MRTELRSIFALLLVIAIDSMNFGFIFPILTPMLLGGQNPILSPDTSVAVHNLIYGLVVAVFPLFMFIGAPILGDLSDYVGRKRVLGICLTGTAVGYLVSGIGVSADLLSLLILGRVISGLTAGSLPLAQAAIADVSQDKSSQAKYMGMMVFAIAAGQVLGPFFAGFFSDKHIVPFFTNSLPFYLATILAIFNLIWLVKAVRETYKVDDLKKLSFTRTIRSFARVFTKHSLWLVSLIFLCMQLSWSFYSQGSPAYLQKMFAYSNFSLGLFSGSLGIFIAIGGVVIMPFLAKCISLKQGTVFALFCMGILPMKVILFFFIIPWGLSLILTTLAIIMENSAFRRYQELPQFAKMLYLSLMENVGYRQLYVYWRLRGFWRYFKGDLRWK